ncbi:2-phosphosulfolactate phosphatase [Halalkalibacter akibai]|uniref:Probable 2-phosphosulfolactate phosphatase n=1 Tax=Halalkalibacter akibai (strain ATCC 43226 / DSM 21942 / CIP 109018 / JCM 9157 / 1139) TaxID=1236973 RepID=W4QXY4_HALA3|nr:2-phosphosulfolactate phosphatase [Halalkalibacter akibai]GAE36936.1 probable 2-phosphosulfolactate phosphatase [Halalkalibacter akibai JCM 9157]
MIKIHQGNSLKLEPSDCNIVIDVIRAFTVAHYAFLNGAKRILLVPTTDEAFSLKRKHPNFVLAGEEHGIGIQGFDFDNSPKRISKERLDNLTIVQKTTNGVQATLNSLNTKHLLVTGYSNAKSTASFVKKVIKGRSSTINIIASHPTGDDDLACAEYIKALILEQNIPANIEIEKRIKQSHVCEKFYDPTNLLFNKADIALCSREHPSNFVMKLVQDSEIPTIERFAL